MVLLIRTLCQIIYLLKGWKFQKDENDPEHSVDPCNGFEFLRQIYLQSNPEYKGLMIYNFPFLYFYCKHASRSRFCMVETYKN